MVKENKEIMNAYKYIIILLMGPKPLGYEYLDSGTRQYFDELMMHCANFNHRENKSETIRIVEIDNKKTEISHSVCSNIEVYITSIYYQIKW